MDCLTDIFEILNNRLEVGLRFFLKPDIGSGGFGTSWGIIFSHLASPDYYIKLILEFNLIFLFYIYHKIFLNKINHKNYNILIIYKI